MKQKVAPRKYLAENVVGLFTQGVIALPPDQLSHKRPYPDHIDDHHIYLICTRPRLAFDPNTFRLEEGLVKGDIVYKIKGNTHKSQFITRFTDDITCKISDYPHNQIITNGKDGELIFLPQHILMKGHMEDRSCGDLEVMYVGQAFGDGNRSAFERLKSHSTLQKILADLSSKRPDEEVVLLLFDYAPYQVITSFDGKGGVEKPHNESEKIFMDIMTNPLSEKQQISIAEAGLIRYFEPKYNKIYKENFPKQDLKILQECYALDFSGVVVEINCEDLASSIYSERQSKGVHHIARYDLHDTEKRRSFFGFMADDEFVSTDKSGPIF